jgi:hypothetical protein
MLKFELTAAEANITFDPLNISSSLKGSSVNFLAVIIITYTCIFKCV